MLMLGVFKAFIIYKQCDFTQAQHITDRQIYKVFDKAKWTESR